MRLLLLAAVMALSLPASDLKPLDETSYPALIGAHKGKVVLVNFWATYCVPCRGGMPKLVALSARLKARGFELVTVSADEPEQAAAARAFAESAKIPEPAYLRKAKDDDKFGAQIDPKWNGALPASFLYDRQGRKVRSFFGELDFAALEAAIGKTL